MAFWCGAAKTLKVLYRWQKTARCGEDSWLASTVLPDHPTQRRSVLAPHLFGDWRWIYISRHVNTITSTINGTKTQVTEWTILELYNRQLIRKSVHVSDSSFIVRMLYKVSYWLLSITITVFSLCYSRLVLSVWLFTRIYGRKKCKNVNDKTSGMFLSYRHV